MIQQREGFQNIEKAGLSTRSRWRGGSIDTTKKEAEGIGNLASAGEKMMGVLENVNNLVSGYLDKSLLRVNQQNDATKERVLLTPRSELNLLKRDHRTSICKF